eukprot:107413_1
MIAREKIKVSCLTEGDKAMKCDYDNTVDGIRLDNRQNQSATKIQANFRGHRGRNKIGDIRRELREQEASTRIQAMQRGRMARKQVEEMRREIQLEEESVVIQSAFRGARPRRQSIEMAHERECEYAALKIQSSYRGHQGRKKAPQVRSVSLKVLSTLYKQKENVDRVALFLDRFAPRVIEMARDKDDSVAVDAIELLTRLLQLGLLEDKDGNEVTLFIWDKNPRIRDAAARFVKVDSFDVDYEEENISEVEKMKADIKEVLTIFGSVSDEDDRVTAAEYMVDSLWDHLPCLKSWDLMAAMAQNDESLSEAESISLTYIVLACARRSMNKLEIPDKKKVSAAKDDSLKEAAEEFQTVFVSELPKMMRAFQAEEAKLFALVQLVLLLDVKEFPTRRKKQALKEMLGALKSILLKSTDAELLPHVGSALVFLANEDFLWVDAAKTALADCVEELKRRFLELAAPDNAEDDRVFSLELCLCRILCLLKRTDCEKLEFGSECERLMRSFLDDQNGIEIVEMLLKIGLLDISWMVIRQKGAEVGDSQVAAPGMKKILKRRSTLLKFITKIFSGNSSAVKAKAFPIVSDLLSCSRALRLMADEGSLGNDEEIVRKMSIFVSELFEDDSCGFAMNTETEKDDLLDARNTVLLSACKVSLAEPSNFLALGASIISQIGRFDGIFDVELKVFIAELKDTSGGDLQQMVFLAMQQIYQATHCGDVQKFVKCVMPSQDAKDYSFVDFVKEGINFGLTNAPDRVDFLDCILPWVRKCSATDKKAIMGSFMESVQVLPEEQSAEEWTDLHDFQEKLRRAAGAVSQRRGKVLDEEEEQKEEGADDVDGSQFGDLSLEPNEVDESSTVSNVGRKRKRAQGRKATTDSDGWVKKLRTRKSRY